MKQTKLSYSKLNIMFHECNCSIISSKKTCTNRIYVTVVYIRP